ncbi:aldehyde dehydrogenase (NAD+)/coniferyl-aldehyde dehydrogenase [Variovorax sp. PDC80]|uniref:coniferyl aldehyde dehydrogenase n=1 Tax=Variovorax sp. PDC80 TaxID=1882827 RepID=UPI0008F3D468|nr:coniferyl aldehyde dehydrogenase [Variovorax sp. PDC80]SFP16584.1 aldehyde dehydrogenase (NAD+)/coniferyl-aldehyde dehydrogenase [Variovorax sp. PDC80]
MTPELRPLFDAQRAASLRDQAPPWSVRADRLRRLRALVREHRAAIAAAISADFSNRPRQETELAEVFPTLEGIDHALRHGKRWMRVRRRSTGLWFKPASSRLMPQPLGVVGIVVPWNYPLYLAAGPLTAALAAGNRAMLKQSEYTPRFAELFARLVGAAFTADEITVVNGDAEVAREFARLPFDHLLFTGSTEVGRHVMRAASEHLTPVTLELGGKSPAIVGRGAAFDKAVERILVGKTLNAGQTCIAPDYVLVPREQQARFVEAARRVFAALYPDLGRNADYTSIVSPRHFARLEALVTEAQAQGAAVERLGDAPADAASRRLPPVLLTGVGDGMRVMQEEIFGPVLPLVPYDTLEEAIGYVNARPRPLALYLFEKQRADIDRVLAQTVAGGVTVNDTLLHIAQDDLPFGGVGASGMGAYHGEFGFQTFSKMKPVFHQSGLNGLGLFKPPYGKTFERMLKLLAR